MYFKRCSKVIGKTVPQNWSGPDTWSGGNWCLW